MYDGNQMNTKAWLHQLQNYFILSPNMVEEDVIYFTSLHFESDALKWWYHGVIIHDYSLITSFNEFARWMVKRFY